MKKILIFGLKDPVGGVESAVMDYVRHFDRDVITADFAVFEDDFSLTEEINSLGGKVHCMPVRRHDPKGYKRVVEKIFAENRYDAVWCNFSGLTNIDFLVHAKKSGVNIRIAHAHTACLAWGSPMMKYPVIAMHEKNKLSVSKYATHFFACSERAAEFMFGKKIAADTRLIPNAVELSKFDTADGKLVRAQLGIDEDALVIGHVGRMCTAKNQKFLLDVFSAVRAKNKNAVLLFVGDGELYYEMAMYAVGKDGVMFTGSRRDVNRLYGAMDVFCLPSLMEGFPVTVVEAQAAGVPCVVSAQAVEKSANISGAVSFVSLDEPVEKWADALIDAASHGKYDCRDKLTETGFEIASAAKRLQDFFAGGDAV